MAMGRGSGGGIVITQWAATKHTFSTAGNTATVTATLPGGQTGIPRVLRASGGVSGIATITYGASAQVIAPINPNAPYTDVLIPATAFPNPTGSVPIKLTGDAAGTLRATVGFQ